MPTLEAHLAAASRNQETLDYLKEGSEVHAAWVVSVAFYKALHVIEAVFAGDPQAPCSHTDNHKRRNNCLKTTNRYKNLWKKYRPLYEASLVARYLHDTNSNATYVKFSHYLPAEKVESIVIGHYLSQIEQSACKLLNRDQLFRP